MKRSMALDPLNTMTVEASLSTQEDSDTQTNNNHRVEPKDRAH